VAKAFFISFLHFFLEFQIMRFILPTFINIRPLILNVKQPGPNQVGWRSASPSDFSSPACHPRKSRFILQGEGRKPNWREDVHSGGAAGEGLYLSIF
jgi:hypothetical protein